MMLFFFFFQAEDGIRDLTVTGVQTCALPICGRGALIGFAVEAVEEIEARVQADGVGVLGGHGPAGGLVDAADVAARGGARARDGREEGAPGRPLPGRSVAHVAPRLDDGRLHLERPPHGLRQRHVLRGLLRAGEPELPVQVRLHPLEAAAAARIGAVRAAGPGGLAARADHDSHDERRYEQRDGPGFGTVQHTAYSAFLAANHLSFPITEASTTSTTGACAGGAINASATVGALARGARPTR